MDSSTQPPQPVIGIVSTAGQIAYSASPYPPAGIVAEARTMIGAPPSTIQPTSALPTNPMEQPSPYQLAFQQVQQFHHQQQQQQQQQLQAFWANQMLEIEQTTDFKNHSLPLARIKKIMKTDEEVRMISAEAPVIFAKACEILVLELTLRAWLHTEENKRRTLQKNDIAAAITKSDTFDFLVDIVPREELKDEVLGTARAALPTVGAAADSVPYYYVPAPGQVPGHGMIMGKPGDQTGVAAMYASPQPHQFAYMWQQPDHEPKTD